MATVNKFGGPWTQIKIDILRKYLRFYTIALQNIFTLHYADAFAGTGRQSPKITESQIDLIPQEDFNGSVLTALEIEPGFHKYHFNDLDPIYIEALWEIRDQYLDKDITITEMDANFFVPQFSKQLGKKDRAVLFVDPFSTELDWDTLVHIGRSKKIDMWLLFPLSVIVRMTKKEGGIIPEWRRTLNRLLGTNEWENALYTPKEQPPIADMFGHEQSEGMERLNPLAVQDWVKLRLEEEFSYVSEPLMLKNKNRPLFSLFLAISNESDKAKALAKRVVRNITKDYL